MAVVTLPQGTYKGLSKNGVDRFHAVPYAGPHERFKSPTKVPLQSGSDPRLADVLGPNCPQEPTRLEFVIGPVPFNAGPQDEAHCGVLSVYRPTNTNGALPTLVFMHGGAFVSGGSQIPWYDGSRLARDGNMIVVSVSYRLGVFGFLYPNDPTASNQPPCGIEDVIAAFEWVRDNIHAFDGDPENVTAAGHSSGGYTVQTLLDLRPDLFHRAIIQSSPAGIVLTLADAKSVRKAVEESLPSGKTAETASPKELLAAQTKAVRSHPKLFMAFMPWSKERTPPGYRCPGKKKNVLLGWTKHDGACFAALGLTATGLPPWLAHPMAFDMSESLTQSIFSGPAKRLATALKEQSHSVTTYEVEWGPEGFELGATHATDLPLLLGDEDAWINAPMLGSVSWAEWERRGRPFREAWGRFARDGSPPPPSIKGLVIHGTT